MGSAMPGHGAALLLGVFNFGNILFYVQAQRHLAHGPALVLALVLSAPASSRRQRSGKAIPDISSGLPGAREG